MTEPPPETIAWLHQAARIDGATYAQVLLLILERLELLETKDKLDAEAWASMRRASCDYQRRLSILEAAQQPRQDKLDRLIEQDREDDEPTHEAAPVATDAELAVCYADAAKVAILNRRDYDKALTQADVLRAQIRAIYNLGREHGAAQARCPHIRSSDEGTSYCSLAEQTAAPQPTPPVALSDALIRAESALSDIAEGEETNAAPNTFEWAEQRCADALAAIRPVMRQHGIRTSEWPGCGFNPPQPAPPAAPAGGLVERVLKVIADPDGPPELWHDDARAVIREVAAWLDQRGQHGCSLWLREEANR